MSFMMWIKVIVCMYGFFCLIELLKKPKHEWRSYEIVLVIVATIWVLKDLPPGCKSAMQRDLDDPYEYKGRGGE